MQQLKIFKSLTNLTVSKFVTSKWIEVNGLSGNKLHVDKNTKFKTQISVATYIVILLATVIIY